jgi:hypothetical protein
MFLMSKLCVSIFIYFWKQRKSESSPHYISLKHAPYGYLLLICILLGWYTLLKQVFSCLALPTPYG